MFFICRPFRAKWVGEPLGYSGALARRYLTSWIVQIRHGAPLRSVPPVVVSVRVVADHDRQAHAVTRRASGSCRRGHDSSDPPHAQRHAQRAARWAWDPSFTLHGPTRIERCYAECDSFEFRVLRVDLPCPSTLPLVAIMRETAGRRSRSRPSAGHGVHRSNSRDRKDARTEGRRVFSTSSRLCGELPSRGGDGAAGHGVHRSFSEFGV